MRPCGTTRAGTQAPPLPNSIIFFHTSHTNKITIYAQSTQTKPTAPRVICPNETVGANIRAQFSQAKCVGAAPACQPERPRSGVSIPRIHALCVGNERWMCPCRATRAGTQAPPLPISIIFCHAIPHKQNSVHAQFTPNEINRPCAIRPYPSPRQPRGVPLPHRGYTFDSAGLASVTQPTLGNDVRDEATPLGGCTFSHHAPLPHTVNGLFANDFPTRKLILKSTMPMA